MKRLFKTIVIIALVFGLAITITIFTLSEPLPEGTSGERADQFAENMLQAINHESWLKTGYVEWNFDDRHFLKWDRIRHFVHVSWDEYEVTVNLDRKTGVAFQSSERLYGELETEAVDRAWALWANDSFWLNPVSKIFDSGTTRKLVSKDESESLLISYSSGGVTPGDSYLWTVDENYLPTGWQMWTSILPIDGIFCTWENWIELETGCMVSTYHDVSLVKLELKNIRAAYHVDDLYGEDPFAALFE